MSFKCCPPFLFHWGLAPVVNTVGTGEGVVAETLDLTSMVDTDRAAKILQPSRIPEEWTPPSESQLLPSSSSRPPAAFLQGQGEKRRRAQQYTLAATHIANLKPSKE